MKRRRTFPWYSLAIVSLLAAGCARPPPPPSLTRNLALEEL